MGYVEDIQKINKLAKELMQHGMASDLDEAVKKAAEMLKGKSDVPAIHSQDLPSSVTQPRNVEPAERMNMSWQDAMSKNNEFIVKELTNTRAQIEEFKAQIASIVAELQNVRKDMHRAPVQQTIQEPKKEVPRVTGGSQSNQRAGMYNPEDVAIDKMFYFGKK